MSTFKGSWKGRKSKSRTSLAKKATITPKQFFNKENVQPANRNPLPKPTPNIPQYMPGDDLFQISSVRRQLMSDPEPLESDDNSSWLGEDDTVAFTLNDYTGTSEATKNNHDGGSSSLTSQSLTSATLSSPPSCSNISSGAAVSTGQQMAVALNLCQSDLMTLLQEQQAMLQQLIDQNKDFALRMDKTDSRLTAVEDLVKTYSISSSGNSTPESRVKQRVARDLTNKISSLYNNIEDEKKFKLNESSTSPHNVTVRSFIVDQLKGSTYSEDQIKGAVKRKYEGLRRQFLLEENSDAELLANETMRKKKYRARIHRKFKNRGDMVRESERQYWNDITLDHMSEESDDPSNSEVIIVHKLNWRSEALNHFLQLLDERYSKSARSKADVFLRKTRKIGADSNASSPPNSPEWMLKK